MDGPPPSLPDAFAPRRSGGARHAALSEPLERSQRQLRQQPKRVLPRAAVALAHLPHRVRCHAQVLDGRVPARVELLHAVVWLRDGQTQAARARRVELVHAVRLLEKVRPHAARRHVARAHDPLCVRASSPPAASALARGLRGALVAERIEEEL